MTQKELDRLIAGDTQEQDSKEPLQSECEHHNMALELGDVTKESEEHATMMIAKLESILEIAESIKETKELNLIDNINQIEAIILDIVATMQYQDLHRQKIERVINSMRSMSKLMNHALYAEDDIAPSAKHIAGDSTEDLLSDEELEALIAEANKK